MYHLTACRCEHEEEGVNCFVDEEQGFLGPAERDPLPWDVLDNGADQTGAQLSLLRKFFGGQVSLKFELQPLAIRTSATVEEAYCSSIFAWQAAPMTCMASR